MKIILFGATGMVGQGVLNECLSDPGVTHVLAVGRSPLQRRHAKLREILHRDFEDFSAIEKDLAGYDACFFCLGVSAAGLNEKSYRRITYDYTLAAAKVLIRRNSDMTFLYVSGAGTDGTAKGRVMWARVKGETENVLFQLPFKAAYMLRPALIQPLDGIQAKQNWYRIFYKLTGPVLPLLQKCLPKYVTTTRNVGRAMIELARQGSEKRVVENEEINRYEPKKPR